MLNRLTIQDVAAAAGVSTGTVSRVINGHSTVALKTRQRVETVMTTLGYTPDPAARQLSFRKGQTLGLSLHVGDPVLHPYHVLFRRALEENTALNGVQLLDFRGDLRQVTRLPSAMIVMHAVSEDDPRLTFLKRRKIPTVLLGHHPEVSWVAPDDRAGGELAAQTLLNAGHQRLCYLGEGPSQVAQDRQTGFRETACQHGASVVSVESNFTSLGGYRAMRKAWEFGLRFTGLFAQSDESAVGAIAALQDLGVSVPEQVSVIGFDGLPELPLPIKLTTIAQDIHQVAVTALQLVNEAISGEAPRGEFIPVQLLPGSTLAPPPGGTT